MSKTKKIRSNDSRNRSSRNTSSRTRKSSNKNIKQPKQYIGCHASIANGILEGIKYVESIGGNALQIFLGSNRSASLKTKHKFRDPGEIAEIKNYITENNICLIIHSIYLLNFCSFPPNSGRIQYMHQNIQYDLKYGQMLGAKCVVLHTGSSRELPVEEAIKNMIANVNHIIAHMPKGIMLSLETSAGKGKEIAWNLEELAQIWKGIRHGNGKGDQRVGICIDTAHIFVSGYDISNVKGITDYMKKFNSLIGLKYITNFHINDSRYPMGARKDEHRGLGHGLIYNTEEGKKALKYIKKMASSLKIPIILETHGAGGMSRGGEDGGHGTKGEEGGYKEDINLLRVM